MITWLSSYPKSGNTWIRLLLNAYFNGGFVDINAMPWGVSDNRRYFYQKVSPVDYCKLTREDIIQLRPAALMNISVGVGQKPCLVKTHNFYGQVNDVHLIPKLFTKRAFYIVRDPREVAPSFARHMNISNDEAIHRMNDESFTIGDCEQSFHVLSSWSKHVESWVNCKDIPVHVIKYAKLKQDPGSILASILDRIGFEHIDHKMIDKAVEATELSKLQDQEKKKPFEECPTGMTDFFGGPNEPLTDAQRSQIENDHGKVMNAIL